MRKVMGIVVAAGLAAGPMAVMVACKKEEAKVAKPAEPKAAAADAAPPKRMTVDHHGIGWYEDEPELALAEARKTGKPVVVDLWAPWCHTCLSMQAYILTDANLPGAKDRFIWLAVNTEKADNAKFLEKIPVEVWPTFYVLDAQGTIRGRWLGSASPAQFMRFLDDGARAADAAGLPPDDPLAMLIAADALAAAKKYKEAAAQYAAAIAAAPADWARKPDALVAQASALSKADDASACVDLALAKIEETGSAVSAADFGYYTVACAEKLDAKDPRQRQAFAAAEKRLTAMCEGGVGELTPDDRVDACSNLAGAREALKDAAGAKKALEKALAIIEEASQGVPDEVALTYDGARGYLMAQLGRGEEALKIFEAREKALPENYNPPHYQARVYKELGRWDEGLAAVERALKLAYGPRKAGIMSLKIDLLLGAGKKDEARKVLEEQQAAFAALPAGQKRPAQEAAVAKRLAEWK